MKLGIRELLFFALMLGLLGCSYVFVFKPAAEKRLARQAETDAKRQALVNLKQSTAGIQDLERKIDEVEKAIKFFESKLPQEKEIDKILREVWQMAEQNALQTRTIKTLKSERNAGYSEQPIQLSLAGDFQGFHAFLRQLEKMSRIVRVNQMKLEKVTARDGEMQAQLTITIYFESEHGQRFAGTN
jgi:type IV pilus assembly protein PilO